MSALICGHNTVKRVNVQSSIGLDAPCALRSRDVRPRGQTVYAGRRRIGHGNPVPGSESDISTHPLARKALARLAGVTDSFHIAAQSDT
jgi:hypothetical protein